MAALARISHLSTSLDVTRGGLLNYLIRSIGYLLINVSSVIWTTLN